MSRLAIFAFWDKDNIISDYVLYYLKKLSSIAENIIFSADCNIDENELKKIKPYVKYIINGNHGEYDFGSYKRGFSYAKEKKLLNELDELIFCNDSCFGPFFDFELYFNKMSISNCDFWGMNFNKRFEEHLESFFLVFKRNVFLSEAFTKFILNVKKQSNKFDVITEYELKLTKYLSLHGFIYDYYYKYPCSFRLYNTIFKEIEKQHYPFLKKSIFVNQFNFIIKWEIINMKKQINSDYPFEHIAKYYQRINFDCPITIKTINFIKIWFFFFIILPRIKDRFYCINQWYEITSK